MNPQQQQTIARLQEAVEVLPKGWTFNSAWQIVDENYPDEGAWAIGFDNEEFRSPIIEVDTGLYYQPQDAEPLARAILARLEPEHDAAIRSLLDLLREQEGEIQRLREVLRLIGLIVIDRDSHDPDEMIERGLSAVCRARSALTPEGR